MRVTARAAGASGEWLPGSVSPVQAASAQLDPGHRTSASHSDIRTHREEDRAHMRHAQATSDIVTYPRLSGDWN